MAVISEYRNHSGGDSVVLGSTLVISECRNHSGGDSVVLGSTLVISECRNYSGGDNVVLGSTLVPHTYPPPPISWDLGQYLSRDNSASLTNKHWVK